MSTTLQILNDPRQYVKAYLQAQGITVNERGELKDSTRRNNLDIFDTMFLDYLGQVKAHNATEKMKAAAMRSVVNPVSEKVLQKALNELITNEKLAYRAKVIAQFKCETEDLTLVRQYVKALTGAEGEDDIAVLSHWMWQVKNKMLDKTPTYHVMPIFYGKQGGGKTVAMTNLIGPINNFRLNISLEDMTDGRFYKSMSENYVIVFDEMQGAARTDIDSLKKQVTIDYNDYRVLGTADVYKVRQACSFIGATNRAVAEQIVDGTGMRRFWQVNCADKLDWDVISNLDYSAMWKGIDENKVNGYFVAQIDSITAKQDAMVAKDDISMFMESHGIVPDKNPTRQVNVGLIYSAYKRFCEDNGYKASNSSWFSRKIQNRGIKGGTKQDATTKKTVNYLEIPEEVKFMGEINLDHMDELLNKPAPLNRFAQARN